jgi:hypothetical protein
MDKNKVEVIIGLDDIVDYSENFDMEKEELFEIFSMVDNKSDIITLIKTKDDKVAFFTSTSVENNNNKQFVLLIHENAIGILNYLQKKYVDTILDFESDEELTRKSANSLLLLAKALVNLANIDYEEYFENFMKENEIGD